MTHEEFVERSAELKSQMDSETRALENDLTRARVKVQRLETRLNGIREQYKRRSAALMDAFMGMSGESVPQDEPSEATAEQKKRRGVLDSPVLELSQEIASPDVTAAQVEEVWNQRNPQARLTSSTVRGILDRLAEKESLKVTDPGGGRGSGIPKKYRPV